MTTATAAVSPVEAAVPSKWRVRTGAILSALLALFLAFDAVAKLLLVAPVVVASRQLGLSLDATAGIGMLLVVCTLLYALPRTATLGALLLTAYLGGAVAIHVRAGSDLFPKIFTIGFGLLLWLGLLLRRPGLFRALWLREVSEPGGERSRQ